MNEIRANKLDRPVMVGRDHVLGDPHAAITLVEYGSYTCPSCHAAHEVIADLRDHFGDRMRYVFRHRPGTGSAMARRAAELAEYAHETTGQFWPVHDALMKRGPVFEIEDLDAIATEHGLPPRLENPAAVAAAERTVDDDTASSHRSGTLLTPTFYINGRRYEGPWDESALSEAMLGSLGHRIHAATLDFARWAPSTGLLLLLMTIVAIVAYNTPLGPGFEALWHASVGVQAGGASFLLPLHEWINHGLLTIFFVVVGLEIKREFTIGRLATRRAAALPVAAALGGMLAPALIYVLIAPEALSHGWGVPIATDTAFAVALIVLLGERVPIELRVFLTAAVIVDDLVSIAVVALFYAGEISATHLVASALLSAALFGLNKAGVYRPLPYGVVGVLLWASLHEAGLHATLAGVILAICTPTRPPANLLMLLAQAETVIRDETGRSGEAVLRHGPSEPALAILDAIHDRIASPADKLLRALEPWSSYVVLPIFALANAGVELSAEVARGHGALMAAVVLGLVVGKPVGLVGVAYLAVRVRVAVKPAGYTWRQLAGACALGGIGFTMSLFIAGQAFPDASDFAAAKIAVFIASLLAGLIGVAILWPRATPDEPTPGPGTPVGPT